MKTIFAFAVVVALGACAAPFVFGPWVRRLFRRQPSWVQPAVLASVGGLAMAAGLALMLFFLTPDADGIFPDPSTFNHADGT